MKLFQILIDYLLSFPEFPIDKIFDGHFDQLYEECKYELKEFKLYEDGNNLYEKIEDKLKELNIPLNSDHKRKTHPDGCLNVFPFGQFKALRCGLPKEGHSEYCFYHTYGLNRAKKVKEDGNTKPDESNLVQRRATTLSLIGCNLTRDEFDKQNGKILGFSDYDEFFNRQKEIINDTDSTTLRSIELLMEIAPSIRLMDKAFMLDKKSSGLVFNREGKIVLLCDE